MKCLSNVFLSEESLWEQRWRRQASLTWEELAVGARFPLHRVTVTATAGVREIR